MHAIIESGAKQYKVKKNDVIDVELLETTKTGAVTFKNVLLVHDGKKVHVGQPVVKGYSVKGKLEAEEPVKGPKVISHKFKRRKDSSRTVGHRQKYHRVKITSIAKAASAKPKVEKEKAADES